MALVKAEKLNDAANGFTELPLVKQLLILIALAASIALGVSIALWTIEPTYRPLYSNLDPHNTSAVLDVLHRSGIPYRISGRDGNVLIPAKELQNARLKLAAEGFAEGGPQANNFLSEKQGFGSSQFIEKMRYLHALEMELARTIAQFNGIRTARVHLAVPKQSVFIRDEHKASASVFVDLFSGKTLTATQVSSIVNLVSSSIPELPNANVTVVDNQGNLLTPGDSNTNMAMASKQLGYQQAVEKAYEKRIIELLTPLVGLGRVKAQVSANIDFTEFEETREYFDPASTAIRSEQTLEETRKLVGGEDGGIPGALSNKPPETEANTQELTAGQPTTAAVVEQEKDVRRQATRNFEVDKTVSYVKQNPGKVNQISVAILLDDFVSVKKNGKLERTPMTPDDIKLFENLIKDAVGFNEKRGDRVTVVSRSFADQPPIEPLPPQKIWEKSWFWDSVKALGGGLLIILLMFGVIKPAFKQLTMNKKIQNKLESTQVTGEQQQDEYANIPKSYEEQMHAVKSLANTDPKRVAHVVKKWIEEDK
ncbi:MAG: flagellar basal-body MS-ring/collar protein FliF [Gammaproteobacteria bacterium]